MKATDKQIDYALILLARNGYSTRYMDASFKRLGATMQQRRGSVEFWLASKSVGEISSLIDALKDDEPQ